MQNKTPQIVMKIDPKSSGSSVSFDGWVPIEEAIKIRREFLGQRIQMNGLKLGVEAGHFRSIRVYGKLLVFLEDLTSPNVFGSPKVLVK